MYINKENIRRFLKDTNDIKFSHILGTTEVQKEERSLLPAGSQKTICEVGRTKTVLKGQLLSLFSHNLSVCHMPVIRLVKKRKDKYFKENIYNNI